MISQLTTVAKYSAPIVSQLDTCNGLWKVEGQCCQLQALVTWQKTDKAKVIESANQVKATISKLHSTFNSLMTKITGLVNITYSHESFSLLTSSLDTCTAFMTQSRAAALCSICSGQSSKYFIKNKAAISQPQCSSMVAACGKFFLETFKLASNLQETTDKVKKFPNLAKVTSGLTKLLKKWIDSKNLKRLGETKLKQALAEYIQRGHVASKKLFEKELCNSLYNLVKNSFIQEIQIVINEVSTKMNDLNDAILNIKVEKAPSRALGNSEKEDPTPAADLNADSQVIEGATSDHEFDTNRQEGQTKEQNDESTNKQLNLDVMPMNLTLAFP